MDSDLDVTALSHGQLVALVYDLRQRLADKEREIARLQQSARKSAPDAEDNTAEAEPPPGTQAALMAQLEQIYPED